MSIWIGCGVLVLLALGLILLPPRRRAGGDERLRLYRDQLGELERDVAAGRMPAEEAEATRLEIQRRMLAADADRTDATLPHSRRRGLAVPLACLVIAAPAALYLELGHPELPDRPAAARGDAGDAGELLVQAAQGAVTPAARKAFQAVLAADPRNPRARFYLALARAQSGDLDGAIQDWSELALGASADAPWLPLVQRQIALTREAQAGRTGGSAPASPTSPDAIASLAPADRQAAIRGMVDGLAARLQQDPSDIEGWLRLGRSRLVLGEREAGIAAYAEAARRAPDRAEVQLAYAHALHDPEAGGEAPPAFVEAMRRVLALDPGNAEALWFVAEDEAARGNRPAARGMLERLIERMPADSPARAVVERQLRQLGEP